MGELSTKERLILFIKKKGLSQGRFEKAVGLSNGFVNNISKGIGADKLQKILCAFPELNQSWLLTGEGEMLKSDSPETCSRDRISDVGMIPFYDAETTGGYNGRVSTTDSVNEIVGYIQPGGWFAGRETAAIRHVGESMTEYPDGCILAVREVLDRNLLVPGKNYVIETSEYRVTKRIQHGSTKDSISLYSTNQEKYEDGRLVYEPFEVMLSDIRKIFCVLGYIVNQSGEFKLIKI